MRLFLSLGAVVLLAVSELHAACGVERWSVKTGTDPQAPSVNLSSYISSTIYNFHQSTRPGSLPSNGRVSPRETTQYRLSGTLTKYVREADSDYHLVIRDSAGRTMIVELPASNCVGAGSPFGPGISRARQQFDARFTATTSMKTTSTPVTIKGIGFWDYIHGQTGVAPNGIEVHPVLDITFGTSAASAPAVQSDEEAVADDSMAELPAVMWPADMVRDDDGGRVHVYRGTGDMKDVLFHGGAVIEDPSIHVLFAGTWPERDKRPALVAARRLDRDEKIRGLDRYGVRTFGFRVASQALPMPDGDVLDLDVQRALAAEVEAGRIQHVDPNAVYVVMLDPSMQPSVGGARDWLSYHSQFHPTEQPLRYVVVRGGLDRAVLQDAIRVSLARALVNPAGDGWY
ncbi:MAG TPA: hypothetical protein VEK57_27510 [Thermoanaerobaculia bacterium]|nr:hypothetical protein [Thermoanaerobaculia bacterium]